MVVTQKSLNRKTLAASTWTLSGYAFRQMMRLGGHLILARLFLPEDFGLIQLIYAFLFGLFMFSDLGLGQNVIQHERGEEASFLQTAWTMQILRGFGIWCVTALIAIPLATIYQREEILWLLPLAGLGALISGFFSTNLWVVQRRIDLRRFTLLEVFSQFVGVVTMVVFAYIYRQIWTLLISSLLASLIKAVLSHFIFPGPKMKLKWDKKDALEIYHFGKWVFLSSFTNFMSSRFDLILMGLYLSQRQLGLYAIASSVVLMIIDGLMMLSGKVLVPLYAHLKRQSFEKMKKKIFEVRASLMFVMLPPLFALTIWGQDIINFVYPIPYYEAGWIVRILAVGGAFRVIKKTIDPLLIAMGDSYNMMLVQLYQAVVLLVMIVMGGQFFGFQGMVIMIVCAQIIHYPILVKLIKPYGVWMPLLDFAGFALTITLVVAVFAAGH